MWTLHRGESDTRFHRVKCLSKRPAISCVVMGAVVEVIDEVGTNDDDSTPSGRAFFFVDEGDK